MIAYRYRIAWSEEDGGFIATVPDLPGASAFGLTYEEAEGEVPSLIEAWIEAAKAVGNPVPPPAVET